ncbi:ABC transporter ATP-binding protein [Clostridium sp.]|uniref:ABC transporter ATP-binding protein n=1 Tax=Clostridium sp. TaxID=1506 RepID=UPI003992E227
MRDIIVIKNLCKDYGDFKNSFRALENINLTISKGEFLAIMGPSGSGKSTLLNLIGTIDIITKGEIYINNVRLKTMPNGELSKFRRENIGFVFQDCNLLDTLTLRDNILAPLALANMELGKSNEIIERTAKLIEINNILDKYPSECSGGEKQRAAICRALVSNPQIIVADEPTASLDTKNSAELLEVLEKLNKNSKITIIMVTHNPVIASYCNRVVMIRDGKLDKEISRNNKEQIGFYKDILLETAKETEIIFNKRKGK